MDNLAVVDAINSILERLDNLEEVTINNYSILDNPVLDGKDLKVNKSGTYIKAVDNVSEALVKLDKLLRTEVLE